MKKLFISVLLLICALNCSAYSWPEKPLGSGEKLFFDEAKIEQARHRIDTYPWASALYEKMKDELANPKPYHGLDSGWYKGHWCRDAALHYRISGDDQYIPEVAKYLALIFSLDTPDALLFPDTTRNNRNFWSWFMLRGGGFVAYDLLRDHPLVKPYVPIMEQRLDEIIAAGFRYKRRIDRLANTQFWGNTALGLTGFMRGNKDAINEAINGENGFKDVLSKFRDGSFFPEPLPYLYGYVDCCMTILAELSRVHGTEDLYQYVAPNGASMKRMIDAYFSVSDPSGLLVTHGDIGQHAMIRNGELVYEGNMIHKGAGYRTNHKMEIFNSVYKDPAYAWAISCNPNRDDRCFTFWGHSALMYGASIENAKKPISRSVSYPEYGSVVVKTQEGREFWDSDAPMLHFRNGASLMYHSHNDHFHFTLYAYHKNILNDWFWEGDYLAPRAGDGYSNATPMSTQLLGHNTVVVDCEPPLISLHHYSKRNQEVQGASLSEIEHKNGMQLFTAEGDVYKGVTHKRTFGVTREYVLDIFEISSDTEHNYDYTLHSLGKVTFMGTDKFSEYPQINDQYKLAPIDKRSKREDNVWLWNAKRASVVSDVNADFIDTDDIGCFTTLLNNASGEIITAELPLMVLGSGWDSTKSLTQKYGINDRKPMFIMRRRAMSTTFFALHQPYKKGADRLKFSKEDNRLIVSGCDFTDYYDLKTGEYKRHRK